MINDVPMKQPVDFFLSPSSWCQWAKKKVGRLRVATSWSLLEVCQLPLLLLILLIKALFMLLLIQSGTIGLVPDEAQYFAWAKLLDIGYYSKPPGIAWQIWLGTKLIGDTELGVRFFVVILSFLISLATYRLSLNCGCRKETAFWTSIAIALSPMGFLSSLMATTDNGLVLFWMLASSLVAHALTKRTQPDYLLLGLIIACGALFKWPIYLFWPFLLFFWLPYPTLRSHRIIYGLTTSLLALLPSFIWNVTHDFATFRHVFTQSTGGYSSKGNPLDFFASQAMLVSPILFLGLLLAVAFLCFKRREIPPPLLFCGGGSFLILSFYMIAAFFQKMQGNWCLFAYPGAIVFLAWLCVEKIAWGKIWLQIGIILSLALSLFGLATPYLEAHSLLNIPYRYNAFHHNLGWDRLPKLLTELGYQQDRHFLFGDKYQMSSILSFYSPGQKRAYFLNLREIRKNQFSYWPSMAREQLGKGGYFAIAEDQGRLTQKKLDFYRETLPKYFDKVEFKGIYPLFKSNGRPEKEVAIFLGYGYNGKEPKETEKY